MHNKGTAGFFWDVSGLGSGVFVAPVSCRISTLQSGVYVVSNSFVLMHVQSRMLEMPK